MTVLEPPNTINLPYIQSNHCTQKLITMSTSQLPCMQINYDANEVRRHETSVWMMHNHDAVNCNSKLRPQWPTFKIASQASGWNIWPGYEKSNRRTNEKTSTTVRSVIRGQLFFRQVDYSTKSACTDLSSELPYTQVNYRICMVITVLLDYCRRHKSITISDR